MKQNAGLRIFAVLGVCFLTNSAFALDQIKLTTGQTVQGDILNDNDQFVDIRLDTGIAKRIPHSAIASIEHDITPPRIETGPRAPIGFVAVDAGGIFVNSNFDANRTLFDYGLKVGFYPGTWSNYKIILAMDYDRAGITKTIADGIYEADGYNDFNLQFLLSPLNHPQFYFGGNLGEVFRSVTIDDVDSGAGGNNFELGLNAGYAFQFGKYLSIGPELRYDHAFGPTHLNTLRFTLAAAVQF